MKKVRPTIFLCFLLFSCGGPSNGYRGVSSLSLDESSFVSQWKITEPEEKLILPLKLGMDYDFYVDWGDGSEESRVTSFSDPDSIHVYERPGVYQVVLRGVCQGFGLEDLSLLYKTQIIAVSNFGNLDWRDLSHSFMGAINLTTFRGGNFSNVENMENMFRGAIEVEPDTRYWDVSSVKDMSNLFRDTKLADPDTSIWNVSNVKSMSGMFQGAESAAPETEDWDTSSVELMTGMFNDAPLANPNTENWVTSNVVNMSRMFMGAIQADPHTENWDTSNVKTISHMFDQAFLANPDTRYWRTSKVTDFSFAFHQAYSADPDVKNWDMSSAENLSHMFSKAYSARPRVENWKTSKVSDISFMFFESGEADPDMGKWDIENLESLSFVIYKSSNSERSTKISDSNYSKFLINLASKDYSETLGSFSTSARAQENAFGARATLINKGWKFIDGGVDL